MAYVTGGNIQAADYNTFATGVTGMNELFADIHQGATTLPNAGYGYGQFPLPTVAIGDVVAAAEWQLLFNTMRLSSTHQVNSANLVVPPLPATGPLAGEVVAAVTNEAAMTGLINSLRTARFTAHPSQLSVITGTGNSNPAPWTSSLVYTFQIDYGSWDNARYFFNTGGSVSITGSYSPTSTPNEAAWASLLSTQFPVNMNWQTTAPTSGGSLVPNPAGFYPSAPFPGLTTAYQQVYRQFPSAAPYSSTNYAMVESRLLAPPGTNGIIQYRVTLIDNDTFPELKPAGRVTFAINRIQSAGAVPYPGSFSFTSGGFVST